MTSLKFFKDKKGNTVIVQKPNYLVFIAIFFFVIEIITTGIMQQIGIWGFRVTILIWAADELFRGDSNFRKVLGLLIGLLVIVGIFVNT